MNKKPKCRLVGSDGNVFSVIANVCKVLKTAGMAEQANEFRTRAFSAASYGDVFVIASEFVEIS